MIAVISSTITPSNVPSHDGPRSNIAPAQRLEQTVESVRSLASLGFEQIFLFDNSPSALTAAESNRLSPARVFSFQHYPYRNKGIAEARLLLAGLEQVPDQTPIMKLSGRYRAARNLIKELQQADFAGKFSSPDGTSGDVSTRAYAVRDRAFLAKLLQGSLDEIYASPWRVVGPRSLLTVLRRLGAAQSDPFPYSDPPFALEVATACWLRRHARTRNLETIGVDGVIGSWINPAVKE